MISKYDFNLDKDMFYLIETLKVESYWSKNNFTLTLQNKDILLLNNIERIVNNLNINIGKRLLLKIRLPDKTTKDEVQLTHRNKRLNFHIEKSPFNIEKVKVVISLSYKKEYSLILNYKNKKVPIKIKCLKNKILCQCDFDSWIYKDLRFPTKKLLNFLEEYCGGNKKLNIEKELSKASKEEIMSAFSALIDCEGSINWYGLKRSIRVRMMNYDYLKQWSNLLKKLEIKNNLRKNSEKEYEITIYGWENFDKLNKMGFKLHHSKKIERWNKIMEGFKRNQISRGSYKDFYISKLKRLNKKTTAKNFAIYLNKSERTLSHFLSKLEKQNLIKRDKGSWPYLYFIST